MTAVDYVILLLALLSILIGVWRGFMTEALSLVTLLAAIALAWLFAPSVEAHLGVWASAGEVRLWAERFIIFVVVLALGGLAQWLARKVVRGTGLPCVDRTLGAVFGFLRAAVVLGLAADRSCFEPRMPSAWPGRANASVCEITSSIRVMVR